MRLSPDRTSPPEAGPDPRLELPLWSTRRLANGLRIDVATRRGTPDVAIRLVLDAGAGIVPPEAPGLASLAGELLVEGAGGRSAIEMAEWLDAMGASFQSRVTYDDAVLSMHTLTDQFVPALEFLAAVTLDPDFDTQEVQRVRGQRLDRILRRADEPAEVASDRLAEAVFGTTHPYGVPLLGSRESISPLDTAALAAFWEHRVSPSAATLVICGDVDPKSVFERVEEQFGEWKENGGMSSAAPPSPGRPARSGDVLLIDRPSSRQTELRLAGLGLARGEDGEIPALVMNAILGGLFNSRINLNLREDKGWTYGAGTTFVRRRGVGPFVLRTAVDTAVTADAFGEVCREFQTMCDSTPTGEELALAKNALTLSLPLQFETKGQIAGRRVESVTYGLPADYWEDYADEVRAVTADEVATAARRFLDPGGLVLLAVGDVARFADDLAEFGNVEVVPATASGEPS